MIALISTNLSVKQEKHLFTFKHVARFFFNCMFLFSKHIPSLLVHCTYQIDTGVTLTTSSQYTYSFMDRVIEKDRERNKLKCRTMADLLPTHAHNRDWNENDVEVLNNLILNMVRHFF